MPPSPHKRSFRRRRNSFSLAMFSRKPKPPPPKISGPLHLARHQPDTSFVLYTSPSFQSLQPNQSFASLQPSPSFQTTTFDPHPGQRVTFPEDFDCGRVPHLASGSSPVKRNLQPSPSFPYLQSSTSVTSISSFDPHPGQRVVLAPSSPSFHSGARKFFYGSGAELPELEFSGSPLWPNTPSSSPQISSPTKGYQDSPTKKYVPRAAGAAPPPRLGRSRSVTPEKEKHATRAPLPRPVRERSISPEKMMHFASVPPTRPVRSRSVTPEKKYAGTPLPRLVRSRSVSSEKKKHVAGAPPPRPPPAPPLGVLREMVPVQGGMLLAAAKENIVDKEDYSFGVKKLFVRAPAESSRVRGRIRHVGLQEGGQIFLQMGAGGGNMDDVQRIGGGSKLTTTGFQYPRSKVLAGETVPYSRSKIGGDANPPVNITITTPNTISSSIESSTWTPVLDPDMLRRAHLLGINVGSSPSVTSVSPPSVRSIRAAKLPERGIPPLYWREMQHNGIWVMILQYTCNSDTCNFSRVCQYAQSIAESHLYHTLIFSPLYPHAVSYSHLTRRITTLIKNHNNNAKFTLYTRRIVIPAGWIQNAVTLIDPSKSSRSYETTTRQSDGGIRELNLVLQGLVRLTRKLESLHCDSPIPINTFLTTSKLATLPHLTKLHLNLSQPPLNFSRHRDTADIVPQQGKYNPAISRWGVLPLKDLRLYGFSEVGGQVHTLVAAVAGSLRNLALETSAEIQQELVLPPLALDTLTLRGFTISSLPSTVQTLTLLNCAGDPEFTTANITTFSTDCANFLYLAVEAVEHGGKKDISFIPSVPVDITSLLKNTLRLHRLILSPSCILHTPVLHEFLLSGCSLAELELPVTSAQWGDFVRAFAMLRWIKKVGVWIAGLEGKEKGRRAEELVQEGDVAGMHLVEVRVNGVGWKVKSGGRMERMGETPERALVLGGGVKVVGMGRGSLVNT